jgi:MFS family permease
MSSIPVSPVEAAAGPPPAARHPITLPHFRNLWIGSTISLLGDQFYLVALPWLVLQMTGSSLALGTVLMTAAVPRAVLMLLGGAVIDRLSARRVLAATAVVRTILVGAVAALVWLGLARLWHIYLLTFAFGIADAFSLPAGPAILPTLVPPEQLGGANALLQSSAVLTQMAGPAPAGIAIRLWGIASALFVDALSFLGVIVALAGIPDPPKAKALDGAPARPSVLSSIAEGLRAVRADPPLFAFLLIVATVNFCVSGPIGVGLATISKFRFGSSAAFGVFLSCFSGGMLVGSILSGRVKNPRKRGLQFIVMSALTGLETVAIGLFLRELPIAILLAVMGLAVGFVNVQVNAWMQMRVEHAVLGRVMSVLMFSAVGLLPISYAIGGALAQKSPALLFVAAGSVLTVVSLLTLTGRAAREID